ncbi:SF-assemblin [Raphidocelis subcapitata]|uniref:SF-assemblin n=1 Tax=Raphidocelis subcapitata TaxID=307507 RepID=A0A2V0NTP9_9CHLO|nr:SF-assemblin [Raphidocelis subcapitata]|eukprot:GBF88940.1 SF-assemblin [Raphidocelis subcapitata]
MYGSSPLRASAASAGALFKSSGPTAKLEHVAERFSAFYSDLEQEKQQRRLAEASRYQTLADSMVKLEKSLEAEIKRRAEADRQMQSHFDEELKALQERTASQYAELSSSFRTSVEGLARTLQDLHAVVKEEREQRRGDVEHLAATLVGKVNECVAALDEERVSRVEAETKTVRQVGADLLRLQERVDAEKGAREAELGQLRGEVHEVLGNRNVTDEKFQAVVLEELAALKTAVAAEREERVAEDDEIIMAVNDYTKALQDGLRIVANS